MAENSAIQWTTHTFNPFRGCTKVSPGCDNCYAEAMSKRNPGVLGEWGPDGTRIVASDDLWRQPLKWNKAAEGLADRPRVFCASIADVFEQWDGPMHGSKGQRLCVYKPNGGLLPVRPCAEEPPDSSRWMTMDDCRLRLFKLIDATPNLDWLLLTKRPEHVRWTMSRLGLSERLPPNVWIGTSVENQDVAWRVAELQQIPASVRFLSVEPLLGPINLTRIYSRNDGCYFNAFTPQFCGMDGWGKLHWVIIGGESGHHARKIDLWHVRAIMDQCRKGGVPVFVKQLGKAAFDGNTTMRQPLKLIDKKGGDLGEWPEDLRVREFPVGARP